MAVIPLVRIIILSTVTLFGLVALGLGAALTNATESILAVYFTYAALAIASGVLTLVSVPPMIALEFIRPGGPTSMIVVEILVLGFLSIMWLATGAETANVLQALDLLGGSVCDTAIDGDDTLKNICGETRGIAAFGFLNWLMLMGYVITLLVLSLQATQRKHTGVWTSSVANAPFGEATAPAEKPSSVPHSYNPYPGPGAQAQEYQHTGGTVQAGTVHV
ncbi:hypothetical protein MKEN_01017400 [Mycena kentingensis (nom. inval.)]|nr:hypothetical protein MKEN_01017400 [Mycena kentingensis (nom. inval.)]